MRVCDSPVRKVPLFMIILSSTAWMPTTNGKVHRVIIVDACPCCKKPNAQASHTVRDQEAFCKSCFGPFHVPPPGRDKRQRS